MATDKEIIAGLGGAARVAEMMHFNKRGGVQRVHNWTKRGIPARIRLAHPELFGAPAQAGRGGADA